MSEIAELKEQAYKALAKVWEAERRERVAANRELVGRAFKFRNSYSCEKWLYAKVVEVEKGGQVIVHEFKIDRGKITIDFKRKQSRLSDGYQEIPASEFARAWRKLQERVASVAVQ